MDTSSSQWRSLGEPAGPGEEQALAAIRALLPNDAVTHAWANVSFVDLQGRTAEVDLLLLSRVGFFLVELKGWHGRIVGDQQSWRLTSPTGSVRTERNPLYATDLKAKRLRSLLSQRAPRGSTVPWIEPLVVLHGRGSRLELAPELQAQVVALDGFEVAGLSSTLRGVLERPPSSGTHRTLVDGPGATRIRQLLQHAGFVATPRTRMVGIYSVESADALAEGPGWHDVLAQHPTLKDVRRRVRIFTVPPGAPQQQRDDVARAARREFVFTQGITHPGIAAPLELVPESDLGPALLFEYDERDVPLDAFMAEHGRTLGLDGRLSLVRQLAEALRYAHQRRLVHRALTPRQVYVRPGRSPQVVVRDWQTGRRTPTTTTAAPTATSFGTSDVRTAVDTSSWVYLAPELHAGSVDAPAIPLDVYGLGALAYLVLTGKAPASSLAELEQSLSADKALDPRRADPDIADCLADLVCEATARVEADRLTGVDDFLAGLDAAEDELTAPAHDAPADERPAAPDPLDAAIGDAIDDRFIVRGTRGTGSTGTALLVDEVTADVTREGVVLKVARDDSAAARLDDEAAVLTKIGRHPNVVTLLDGPLHVGDRRALLLSDAGKQTLAGWLEAKGRSPLDELERFGGQLLDAVAHLDGQGVFHRDVKPANIGVGQDPSTRRPRLVLFDLSLAREPLEHVGSGTRGYLDPYLGRTDVPPAARRPRFDRAAELYAVAVTLYEMATTNAPWWADGDLAPASATDRVVVDEPMFEAAVAPAMAAFFRRALAPAAGDRFADAVAMAAAWRAVFAALDEQAGDDDDATRDQAAAAATLDTPLAAAGLSARALSALSRLDATTVGELLRTSPLQINGLPGLGEQLRKEVQRRKREWRARLLAQPTTTQETTPLAADRGVESTLAALAKARDGEHTRLLQVVLGLDGDAVWPDAAHVARATGATRAAVGDALDAALARWQKSPLVAELHDEVAAVLMDEQRIGTLREVAAALLLRHGSTAEGPARNAHAAGLVRAVIEADEAAPEPAFAVRRSGDLVLLALRPHTALLDEAATLPEAVGAVLGTQAVVPAATARAELRARLGRLMSDPRVIGDDRLLRLAAATSDAHLSSLHELYADRLTARQAVEIALRTVTTPTLSEAGIRRRVATRFPAASSLPARPELDALVQAALPAVRWDGAHYARPTHRSTASSTSVQAVTTQSADAVDQHLRRSIASSSALTLCAPPRVHDETAAALADAYGVTVVDVAAELLSAMHALADRDHVDWSVVLGTDARTDHPDWPMLCGLVAEAMGGPWARIGADERPLLLVRAAPLARYGLAHLVSGLLDQASPRPAARWLLVPRRPSQRVPALDGRPVPLGADGWIDVPDDLTTRTITGALA
ncbi:BREX system serine/threonine kinase PglW [Cellulomonas sp. HZM]|uniref:BREX system serine/threonine kinase PglW n=1 Tax=Cellulomonas sp. HZM TaxID=1454010 RepID=UPI0004937049|nr:BREX system serine/threonine kinase PglW [Cellulomonas sp. HZM]